MIGQLPVVVVILIALSVVSSNALVLRNASGADINDLNSFTGERFLKDDELADILKELPDIKHLQLDGCNQLTDRCLPAIAALKHLDTLVLPRQADITTEGLRKLAGLKLETNAPGAFFRERTPEPFGIWIRMHRDVSRVNSGCWDLREFGSGADGDEWIHQFVGLPGVRMLSLKKEGTTNAGLSLLRQVPDLETLWLSSQSNISDEGLRELAGSKKLKALHIRCECNSATASKECKPTIGPKALKGLSGLQLTELFLGGCVQTEEALAPYVDALSAESHDRNSLMFQRPAAGRRQAWEFTVLATEGLAGKAGIKRIFIRGTGEGYRWEEAAMPVLWSLPDLEEVNLSDVAVTGAGFAGCENARKLRRVDIDSSENLTEEFFEAIARCTELQELTVRSSLVTEKGLLALKGCKALRKLSVGNVGARMSQRVDIELRKSLPDCEVKLERGRY